MSAQQSNMNANKTSAMSGSIHRANTVDISKFNFGDPITNKYGGKSSRVKYDGQDFYIQTPRMRLPYGLSIYQEKDNDGKVIPNKTPKYSLDFSFAGYEVGENGQPNDPKVREFYDLLVSMQQLLIKTAAKNSLTWLNIEDGNEALAKALTRDTIRFAKDKVTKKVTNKYPPSLKCKVSFWEDRFLVNAYDENKNPITDFKSAAVPRSEGVAILKLTGVNFAGGKVGYAFQVHQIKLYRPSSMPSYAFIEDDTDNRPVQTDLADEEDDEVVAKPTNHVDDSEDEKDELDQEQEDEEEEDRPPTPPPQPKGGKTKLKINTAKTPGKK